MASITLLSPQGFQLLSFIFHQIVAIAFYIFASKGEVGNLQNLRI